MNNGYANIVRYGTIKYAIIEQLKNPTPGFEDVIRRNFFLKKDMIMAEVDGWIERDKSESANYTDSLTTSHNPDIAAMLGEDDKAYRNKLIELRKELLTEFAKLDSPYQDTSGEKAPETSTSKEDENKDASSPTKTEKVKVIEEEKKAPQAKPAEASAFMTEE